MLHMHVINAIDEALNAAVTADGRYSGVETTRMEKDREIAREIRVGRIAPLHADVEAMRPVDLLEDGSLPDHTFYTVVAYRPDGRGGEDGVTTAIIAPAGFGRNVTTMTKADLQAAAVRQLQPMLDASNR